MDKVKVLLLDADGVTLVNQGYFSDVYSREYGVPIEKIVPFFKKEFRNCQLGKKDIKDALPEYLAQWGWQGSIEDFLRYWFRTSTVTEEQVLNKIQRIRNKGIQCYLATDQEKYRAEYIKKVLNFEQRFDGCFFSCEIGFSKAQLEFFRGVLSHLNLSPQVVGFLDDDEENVRVAKETGIQAKLYSDPSALEAYLV